MALKWFIFSFPPFPTLHGAAAHHYSDMTMSIIAAQIASWHPEILPEEHQGPGDVDGISKRGCVWRILHCDQIYKPKLDIRYQG